MWHRARDPRRRRASTAPGIPECQAVRARVNVGAVDEFYEKTYEVDLKDVRSLVDAEFPRRQAT